jgi:hypothetical protein
MNPRQGKKLIGLWLTQEEAKRVKELKDMKVWKLEDLRSMGEILLLVMARGDMTE